jgi:hypothetical protein
VKTLVSNSTFDRGSLVVAYIKPFDLLVDGNENGNWLGVWDSNSDDATGNDRDFKRPGFKIFNPFKELS